MPMAPTPFGFFQVEEKVLGPDAAPFGEAQFGKAPEAFAAMDVIFAAGKLVLMMVDAGMLVATQHEAVIGLPAVGIDRGRGKHLPLDERQQCSLGAVFDALGENLSATLEQADHGRFSTGPAPAEEAEGTSGGWQMGESFAAHPARAKVAFVDLHLARKRPRFCHRQLHDPQTQPIVRPLRTWHAQPN